MGAANLALQASVELSAEDWHSARVFSLSLMSGMSLVSFDTYTLISINCTYQDGEIHNTLMYKITMT